MPRDYRAVTAALRAKAADSSCTAEESEALISKAKELEDKYKVAPPLVTGREVFNWAESHADWPRHDKWPPSGPVVGVQYGWPIHETAIYITFNFPGWLADLDEEPLDYDWGVDPK